MKALAVIGTARKSGLIGRLCAALLEGARAAGHETETINLYDCNIEPCRGCWACAKKGSCVIDDDFCDLFEKIRAADAVVLGSPCYWGNVTGVMKNFFDRHTGYALVKPKNASGFAKMRFLDKIKTLLKLMKSFGPEPQLRGKLFVIVTAITVPFPVSYLSGDRRGAINAMRTYAGNLKGRLAGKLVFTDSLFRFRKNKERRYLNKARSIGRKLVL